MHDKMMKMLMSKKKEGKTLSDSEKKSKLQALGGMKDLATKMMGDKLKNLKKVTVASDSKSGLQSGLHKAEDLMSQMPDDEDQDQENSAYADGGDVKDNDSSSNQSPVDPDKLKQMQEGMKSVFNKGGKVGEMDENFDQDQDHIQEEHDRDASPRQFHDGGMMDEESMDHESSESSDEENQEQESMDKIVAESPNDPDDLDELIRKLEEKKQQLSK